MSTQYLSVVRQTLETILIKIAPLVDCDPEGALEKMILRPPKNPGWGDLCTNILLLIFNDENGEREKIGAEFIEELQKIDFVESATLSEKGYLNLKINSDYWGDQLLDICQDGVAYGFREKGAINEPFVAMKPDSTEDLVSLRQLWTVETLTELAGIVGVQVTPQTWTVQEKRGFSSKSAVARCSEKTLKLSLLSNSTDFAVTFSPRLAIDRSYDNPAFSFPYTLARIETLLKQHSVDEISDDGMISLEPIEKVNFTKEIEIELAKHLCQWPLYVKKALKLGDMSYLTSFLQEITLLFFKLYRQERIQSSDYLSEKGHKNARKLLLKSVSTQINGCLKLMGIDRAEEFI